MFEGKVFKASYTGGEQNREGGQKDEIDIYKARYFQAIMEKELEIIFCSRV